MTVTSATERTIQYNGETAKISSESAAYYTIVTENGSRVSVPKNSALLSFANNKDEWVEEYLAENQEKIKQYKHDWNEAKDTKWNFIAQLGSFWKNLGLTSGSFDQLNGEQKAKYNELADGKYNAVDTMHKASAGVHSTVRASLNAIYHA